MLGKIHEGSGAKIWKKKKKRKRGRGGRGGEEEGERRKRGRGRGGRGGEGEGEGEGPTWMTLRFDDEDTMLSLTWLRSTKSVCLYLQARGRL
jgi:hypothetical protein